MCLGGSHGAVHELDGVCLSVCLSVRKRGTPCTELAPRPAGRSSGSHWATCSFLPGLPGLPGGCDRPDPAKGSVQGCETGRATPLLEKDVWVCQ